MISNTSDELEGCVMVKNWKRLPGHASEPAGLERTVLRRLPKLTLWSTLSVLSLPVGARMQWGAETGEEAYRAVMLADMWAVSLIGLIWSAVVFVALFCFIVLVMKGPAFIADAYELPDDDEPDPPRRR